MHPILLEIGPLTLRAYGLAMALSYVAGIALLVVLNRREGRSDDLALDMAVWIMAGAVVGARILYVIVQPEQFKGNWLSIFAVWQGGLVYYGGLLGSSMMGYWFLRRRKAPVWSVADCIAPGMALGQSIGRVGCFFNGCCYGKVSHEHGVVFPALGDNLPHLPVQLWETAAMLVLAVALYRVKPHRRYRGQVFVLFLWIYGVARFIIEFWRGDAERGVLISDLLSPSQWGSLAAIAVGLWLHFHLRDASSNDNQGAGNRGQGADL